MSLADGRDGDKKIWPGQRYSILGMIWNNYGQHSQETIHMVPHATGKVFVPSNWKGKAKVPWNESRTTTSRLQTCGEFTPHPCESWLWKWSCHWPLNLPWPAIGKDLAHLEERKRKKVKPKLPCLIRFRLFRRHLGASDQFFIEMLFLTLAYVALALAFDIDHFRPPPRSWLLIHSQQSNSCPWCHFRSLLPTPTALSIIYWMSLNSKNLCCTPSISVCFHFMLYFPHAQA